jgi:hypothetical protein
MKIVIGTALVAATLFSAVPGASAQGNNAFCLQRGSRMDCTYQSMAQCDQAKKGVSTEGTCVANPQTTGSGAGSPGRMAPGGGMQQPGGAAR